MEYDDGTLLRAEGDEAEEIATNFHCHQIIDTLRSGRNYSGPTLKRVEKRDGIGGPQ